MSGLREFQEWLNERRGCSVAPIFHDIVAQVEALSAAQAGVPHPACKPDMLVNGGALKLALSVLRRAGKNEVADELEMTAQPSPSPAPARVNTKTHDLLSTMIGLFLGAKDKIGYKPGSVIDKVVAEAVEHLKDWPYPEPAPAQPGQEGLPALFREALAWGMVYGPEIPAHQWDEMRESMVKQYADRAARAAPQPATADAVDAERYRALREYADDWAIEFVGNPEILAGSFAALDRIADEAIVAQRGVKP